MQDGSSDPKQLGIGNNAADAGQSQEEQPLWHAPVLHRMDIDLTLTRNAGGSTRLDGQGNHRS